MHTSILINTRKFEFEERTKSRNEGGEGREKKGKIINQQQRHAASPTELKERNKREKKIKLSTDVIRRRRNKRNKKKERRKREGKGKHGYLERDEEKQDQHGETERERSVSSSSRFILRSQRSISFRFSSTYTRSILVPRLEAAR